MTMVSGVAYTYTKMPYTVYYI